MNIPIKLYELYETCLLLFRAKILKKGTILLFVVLKSRSSCALPSPLPFLKLISYRKSMDIWHLPNLQYVSIGSLTVVTQACNPSYWGD